MNMRKRFSKLKERTSVSGLKGIITIEAALALPIFMFAVLSLISTIEVHCIRVKMQYALLNAGKEAAVCMVKVPYLNTGKLSTDIINSIGSERINNSIIQNKVSGVSCSESYYSSITGDINLRLKYKIKLPFPDFTHLSKEIEEEGRVRAWGGFYNVDGNPEEDEIVYVTKHGSVYHSDHNCTYLKPSVRYIPYSDIDSYKNKNGGMYTKCDKCVNGESYAGVYITDYGEKYHNSLKCSALKRTVMAVKKSEAEGKGGCSKCSH